MLPRRWRLNGRKRFKDSSPRYASSSTLGLAALEVGRIQTPFRGLTPVIDPGKFEQNHVVITTYGTVQSEFNADPTKKRAMKALFAVKWWRIVLGIRFLLNLYQPIPQQNLISLRRSTYNQEQVNQECEGLLRARRQLPLVSHRHSYVGHVVNRMSSPC